MEVGTVSKLKVGMYVRTKEWGIQKIAWFDNEEPIMECGFTVFQKSGYKTSNNIIDLIEENDFINGLRVEKNKYGELYTSYVYYGGDIGKQCEVYTTWLKEYTEDMIENIVTKEQFESISYKVGE